MTLRDILGLAAPSSLRSPEPHEGASITTALIHMPSPRLATIADQDLAPLVHEAIAHGGGIVQMGLAPPDLEIEGERFAARCDLRLSTPASSLEIRIEGSIDARGRVEPRTATLLGVRRPARAAA